MKKKRKSDFKGMFWLTHRETQAGLLPIPPAWEGRRPNPLFCPTCILPRCLGDNWERPNLKAKHLAATYRGDQQNGKRDF